MRFGRPNSTRAASPKPIYSDQFAITITGPDHNTDIGPSCLYREVKQPVPNHEAKERRARAYGPKKSAEAKGLAAKR